MFVLENFGHGYLFRKFRAPLKIRRLLLNYKQQGVEYNEKHAHTLYINSNAVFEKFQLKIVDTFNIFAQNIAFVYTLEPPH